MKKKANTKKQNNSRINPIGDKVLIKVDEGKNEKNNEFGIIIPDTIEKERPEQGKVVAVGEGRINDNGEIIPMRIKIGDHVIFSRYGFDEVKVEKEEFILVSESNILAIIK